MQNRKAARTENEMTELADFRVPSVNTERVMTVNILLVDDEPANLLVLLTAAISRYRGIAISRTFQHLTLCGRLPS
ncbi:MAG: hypothetical protein JWN70_3907 [Planctomycetaceae bacterium]|nr:hypothetical protein [Planctomycetaceae bacterium]